MDRYRISAETCSLTGYFFFGYSIPFTIAWVYQMKAHRKFQKMLQNESYNQVIDLNQTNAHSRLSELKDEYALVKGYAISASTLKENNWDYKAALNAIPAKIPAFKPLRDGDRQIPREIVTEYTSYDIINRTGFELKSSDFRLGTESPISVKLGTMTAFEGLKLHK